MGDEERDYKTSWLAVCQIPSWALRPMTFLRGSEKIKVVPMKIYAMSFQNPSNRVLAAVAGRAVASSPSYSIFL